LIVISANLFFFFLSAMFAVQKVAKKGWLNTDLILTVQRFWVDDAAFVNKCRSVLLRTDAFYFCTFSLRKEKSANIIKKR
jgi:hypothetical protein